MLLFDFIVDFVELVLNSVQLYHSSFIVCFEFFEIGTSKVQYLCFGSFFSSDASNGIGGVILKDFVFDPLRVDRDMFQTVISFSE